MPEINFSEIKTPYLTADYIEKRAVLFRKKYWNDSLPIDIEKIIDVSLEIDLVPVPDMEKRCNTNVLIASNWNLLYIDKDLFDDERRYSRLRFSLAHEIGHFILHKDFYSSFKILSIDDFYNFIEKISPKQYSYLETQANKFAGYLLVPRNILDLELNKLLEKSNKVEDLKKIDEKMLRSYLSVPLSEKFGVSQECMEIILGEKNAPLIK